MSDPRRAPAAVAMALLWVAAIAAPPADADPMRRGHPPGGLVAKYAERLGLDPGASDGVRAIVQLSGERDESLREELVAAKLRMRELMNESHQPDAATVMAQAEAIGAVEIAIHKNRLAAILQIRALLTPEQRAELMRIRDEKHPHGWKRGGDHLADCDPDLGEHCAEVEAGPASLTCLLAHWDELSEGCRDTFDRARRAGDHGRR